MGGSIRVCQESERCRGKITRNIDRIESPRQICRMRVTNASVSEHCVKCVDAHTIAYLASKPAIISPIMARTMLLDHRLSQCSRFVDAFARDADGGAFALSPPIVFLI